MSKARGECDILEFGGITRRVTGRALRSRPESGSRSERGRQASEDCGGLDTHDDSFAFDFKIVNFLAIKDVCWPGSEAARDSCFRGESKKTKEKQDSFIDGSAADLAAEVSAEVDESRAARKSSQAEFANSEPSARKTRRRGRRKKKNEDSQAMETEQEDFEQPEAGSGLEGPMHETSGVTFVQGAAPPSTPSRSPPISSTSTAASDSYSGGLIKGFMIEMQAIADQVGPGLMRDPITHSLIATFMEGLSRRT